MSDDVGAIGGGMASIVEAGSLQMKVDDEWVDLSGSISDIEVSQVSEGPYDVHAYPWEGDYSFSVTFSMSPLERARLVYCVFRAMGMGRWACLVGAIEVLWGALRARLGGE